MSQNPTLVQPPKQLKGGVSINDITNNPDFYTQKPEVQKEIFKQADPSFGKLDLEAQDFAINEVNGKFKQKQQDIRDESWIYGPLGNVITGIPGGQALQRGLVNTVKPVENWHRQNFSGKPQIPQDVNSFEGILKSDAYNTGLPFSEVNHPIGNLAGNLTGAFRSFGGLSKYLGGGIPGMAKASGLIPLGYHAPEVLAGNETPLQAGIQIPIEIGANLIGLKTFGPGIGGRLANSAFQGVTQGGSGGIGSIANDLATGQRPDINRALKTALQQGGIGAGIGLAMGGNHPQLKGQLKGKVQTERPIGLKGIQNYKDTPPPPPPPPGGPSGGDPRGGRVVFKGKPLKREPMGRQYLTGHVEKTQGKVTVDPSTKKAREFTATAKKNLNGILNTEGATDKATLQGRISALNRYHKKVSAGIQDFPADTKAAGEQHLSSVRDHHKALSEEYQQKYGKQAKGQGKQPKGKQPAKGKQEAPAVKPSADKGEKPKEVKGRIDDEARYTGLGSEDARKALAPKQSTPKAEKPKPVAPKHPPASVQKASLKKAIKQGAPVKFKYEAEESGTRQSSTFEDKFDLPYELGSNEKGDFVRVINEDGKPTLRYIDLGEGRSGIRSGVEVSTERFPFTHDLEGVYKKTGEPGRFRVLDEDGNEVTYGSETLHKHSSLKAKAEKMPSIREKIAKGERVTVDEVVEGYKGKQRAEIQKELEGMSHEELDRLHKEVTGEDCI